MGQILKTFYILHHSPCQSFLLCETGDVRTKKMTIII